MGSSGGKVRVLRAAIVLATLVAVGVAFAASGAQAAAKKLDMTYNIEILGKQFEQQVETGEEVRIASATGVTFESTAGNISCPSSAYPNDTGFEASLLSNNQPKDTLAITGLFGSISRNPFCASTIPSHPSVEVAMTLPVGTTLSLGANGKAEITTPKEDPGTFGVDYTLFVGCVFKVVKLKGTLTPKPSATSKVVGLTFVKQKLKLLPREEGFCPKAMLFSGVFPSQLRNNTNVVYAHLN